MSGEQVLVHKFGQRLEILSRYPSFSKLENSKIYRSLHGEIEPLLEGHEFGCYADEARAAKKPFYRAVSWDLHHGKGYDGILEILKGHNLISKADLFLLPSVDLGMARTGNRNVARSLAMELELNYVFAPSYLHLQSEDRPNHVGLDGNAILSRYPLLNPRVIRLNNCSDTLKGVDKCLGHQKALMVDVALADQVVTVVCIHTDVLSSPRQRAAQLRRVLHLIEEERPPHPVLIGGVFNTSTYNAHTSVGLIAGLVNKMARGIDYIFEEHHTYPERHFDKPLFHALKNFRYHYEDLNELGQGTFHYTMDDIRTNPLLRQVIPGWLMRLIGKTMRRHGDKISFKMDWFAANDKVRASSHPHAEKPKVVTHLFDHYGRLSIHDALLLDFEIP